MKKYSILLLIIVILTYGCNDENKPEFDHYGVYLKTKDGFIELKNHKFVDYGGFDYFKNSKGFKPPTFNLDGVIDIYVFDPKSKIQSYNLYDGITINERAKRKEHFGNFGCRGYGYKKNECSEIEILRIPYEKNNELLKISTKNFLGGTLALIIDNEKGYLFNVFNEKLESDLLSQISLMVTYLEEENYALFVKTGFPNETSSMTNDELVEYINEMQEYFNKKNLKSHIIYFLKMAQDSGVNINITKKTARVNFGDIGFNYHNGNWGLGKSKK